jgi:hypothetical protein
MITAFKYTERYVQTKDKYRKHMTHKKGKQNKGDMINLTEKRLK